MIGYSSMRKSPLCCSGGRETPWNYSKGRFYSNTAGGQNDTYKLPEPEPVPSSPAVDNLASLRTWVMWDHGVLLKAALPGSSWYPSLLLLLEAAEMTVIILLPHHAILTHFSTFLRGMHFSLSALSSSNSPSWEREEKGGYSTSA